MSTTTQPTITIAGATATGKSDLALNLAEHLGGEIINTDSMQFYRGMDIGTAKLPIDERRGITHHLIDILDVREEANVQTFQRQAREAIADIRTRGKRPILVGGSGLYVRAATDRMEFPGTDPDVRARIESEVEADRWGRHRHLQEIDPAAAAKITPNDSRRIVRALEVIELTGRPFSAQLPDYQAIEPTIHLGLSVERKILHERIASRVEAMWEHGWVDEVRSLLERGLAEGRTASRAIGYAQIQQYLAGKLDRDDAQEQTTIRTRQFARRQDTWFRRDPRIVWIDATEGDHEANAASALEAVATTTS
ncbi:MAG: tRNA (adenosine(37)-N6)-dimethylallyltransferase MiaA [Brevibacterium aurantiacum]|uniref:tRNA dimethylallyltransferase n=2 Tax=Brevibacterium aurantiacum TaxID=273384 RepID=A0A2A3YV68_BREAU|nr:tRNA (adenosine(37)-N6)-dimethylallyltransferase MiaA [Brevibacterium aurantiacum]MDN5608796.1 tRNA (adenosine(37)-N6)-dimethylallyltransferase MiaA [Brevibacterium sp.]AZL09833.1 tRNA (adenosine(37)-N6)-dimethylallyltransferase MiaA [Brevibacterium aurantiacum]AZT93996.1 tRNA (adenosine(37)-N6)-dimethylallyltransferase MiaA [Brevibacterium aurantiacum]AZT97796.1 tRNA (adenosine(37)-N6)-dimethylallyltransferase MiaA [Brevibacterium aurantiacum]MDN6373760.1 tRNA (adenosine(37)-N6)-dimethylal